MTEEQIRNLIREELASVLIGHTFSKHIQLLDGRNIQTGKTTGSKIATETTQKLGFYNTTPVDQPATIADPSGGITQDAEARKAINTLIDRLQEIGLIA